MDIVGGLAAASQALGIAKALRGIEKDYDAATYRAQIAELIDALTDAKLALTDAKGAVAERDEEIKKLRASFDVKAQLVKGEGDYNYFTGEDGKPVGFPVCPGCETNGRIIQLKQAGPPNQAQCPSCEKTYKPVSCFLAGGAGDTLEAQQSRRASAALDRVNAQLRGGRRGRNDWMA